MNWQLEIVKIAIKVAKRYFIAIEEVTIRHESCIKFTTTLLNQ